MATEASHNTPTPRTDSVPVTPASVYQGLFTYPFDTDQEYQAGLATILGHPETPVTSDELIDKKELVLQARCFYFSRKFALPPIDPVAYSSWLLSRSQADPSPSRDPQSQIPVAQHISSAEESVPSAVSQLNPASSSEPEPPYPTSFAHIVDLITRNMPIPGIEEIPNTVLEPGSSKIDKNPRRRKPWETDADPDRTSNASASPQTEPLPPAVVEMGENGDVVDLNGHRETGQGVVNILKPNAVPDSGLLSKD
ncbi:hypothetical protein PV08_02587 [Exophiala spinifera]|uniref:Uncharacterized protein n=1 Tax=Exophiala spinifera TaxID=91928 RepID=A0A0D2C3T0_9EURO|nr:uncharacterized protein PV08_02587 [Exophiala spinifera]KIW18299.1 hypothetical protein PV08_02587 [Exophiala spinifera]